MLPGRTRLSEVRAVCERLELERVRHRVPSEREHLFGFGAGFVSVLGGSHGTAETTAIALEGRERECRGAVLGGQAHSKLCELLGAADGGQGVGLGVEGAEAPGDGGEGEERRDAVGGEGEGGEARAARQAAYGAAEGGSWAGGRGRRIRGWGTSKGRRAGAGPMLPN